MAEGQRVDIIEYDDDDEEEEVDENGLEQMQIEEAVAAAAEVEIDPIRLLMEETRLSRPLSVILCVNYNNCMANVMGTRDSLALALVATFIHHSIVRPVEGSAVETRSALNLEYATGILYHFRKAGNTLFKTKENYVFDQEVYDYAMMRIPDLCSKLDPTIPCIFVVQEENGKLYGASRGNWPSLLFIKAVCASGNCDDFPALQTRCKALAEERKLGNLAKTIFYKTLKEAHDTTLTFQ